MRREIEQSPVQARLPGCAAAIKARAVKAGLRENAVRMPPSASLIQLPTREGVLTLRASLLFPMSRNWRKRLAAAAQAHPSAQAFVWDDVGVETLSRLRIQPVRVRWPAPEPLILVQTDQTGRCAIRSDTLARLYADGHIAGPDDVGGGLRALAMHSPGAIVRLADIARFTGAIDDSLYQRVTPPPDAPGKATGVSVLINYRDNPELTIKAAQSAAAQNLRIPLELVLIDNCSSAGARLAVDAALDSLAPRASIRRLDYRQPYNHSAQNNLGAEAAQHEVIVLLNNDAHFLDPDCLQTMADWAVSPGICAVAPRIHGDGGRLVACGVAVRSESVPPLLEENESAALGPIVRPTSAAPFACAAVSKAVWRDLGGLDADAYPTQYNDADFCLRGLARGLRNLVLGHLRAFHEPGQSEARSQASTQERLAHLRTRWPDMALHADLDPQTGPFAGDLSFESPTANIALAAAALWRSGRAIGADIKKRL